MPTANPGRAAIYCPKARCQSLKHRRFPSFFVFLRILQITLIYKCEFHQVTLARLGAIGYIPRSPTQANSLASTPAERCRSGRTGRSRKPLCAQAYRGFESLPLRHPPPKSQLCVLSAAKAPRSWGLSSRASEQRHSHLTIWSHYLRSSQFAI
jgi:hypothetical protein